MWLLRINFFYHKLRPYSSSTVLTIISRLPDINGVLNLRGDIETDRRRRDLPLPGRPSSAAGPAPQLQRRLALRHRDLEVRTRTRLLQRPHAVSPTCNAEHMPRYAHMGEVHQQRMNLLSDGKRTNLFFNFVV